MKRLMAAAHALIEQRFYVFPLRPGDKRPLPHFKHWEQRATRDPDLVYQWWSMAPYNIGVATGPSQLLVVDCDTRPDNAALDWRNVKNRMWILGQQLPQTFSVRTPSSGLHLYFAAPETWLWETQQANSASTLTRGVPAATSLAPDPFIQDGFTWSLIVFLLHHFPPGSLNCSRRGRSHNHRSREVSEFRVAT